MRSCEGKKGGLGWVFFFWFQNGHFDLHNLDAFVRICKYMCIDGVSWIRVVGAAVAGRGGKKSVFVFSVISYIVSNFK